MCCPFDHFPRPKPKPERLFVIPFWLGLAFVPFCLWLGFHKATY